MNGVITLRRLSPLASGAIVLVCLFDLALLLGLRRVFSTGQLL